MPRRKGAVSAYDAAQAARNRFAARLGVDVGVPALLPLPVHAGKTLAEPRHYGPETEPSVDDPDAIVAEPQRPLRVRWRTPWRVAAILAIPCLALLAWFGWKAFAAQPASEPLVRSSLAGRAASATANATAAGPTGSEGGQQVLVHIAGAVKNPGVVKLAAGSRISDAIEAAGGPLPGAEIDTLNLAAVLEDASKIHVPRAGEAVPAPTTGSTTGHGGPSDVTAGGSKAGGAGSSTKLNLNTATAEELDALPKVGPVLAKRIVEWRQEHGPFAAVEDLDAVDGVGPKMMETLLPLVTV